MNTKLAQRAVKAVTDPAFCARRGMCQCFARQVIQAELGDAYDDYHGPNATVSAYRWRRGGYAVSGSPERGDLLYKTNGEFGHVGIYVGGVEGRGQDLVAENSSKSIGRVQGAKGYRSLRDYGPWDILVRIPGECAAASSDYTLVLHGKAVARMPVHDGRAYVPATVFAERLGLEVGWLDEEKLVTFDDKVIELSPWIRLSDSRAYLPIRALAEAVGLAIEEPDEQRRVVLYRP